MPPRMKPEHYKPEEVEKHETGGKNGFTPAPQGGTSEPQPFRKPTRETREAAERATRSALMDCYNG